MSISLLLLSVPIGFIWAIASMIWRTQEMRIVARSITDVAARLSEPENIATDAVVNVSQADPPRSRGRRRRHRARPRPRQRTRTPRPQRGRGARALLFRQRDAHALADRRPCRPARSDRHQLRARPHLDRLARRNPSPRTSASRRESIAENVTHAGNRITMALTDRGEQITVALADAGETMVDQLAARGEDLVSPPRRHRQRRRRLARPDRLRGDRGAPRAAAPRSTTRSSPPAAPWPTPSPSAAAK